MNFIIRNPVSDLTCSIHIYTYVVYNIINKIYVT